MALSPSIPTSFVPKQPTEQNRRAASGNNIFLLIAIVLLVLTVISAGSVFLYGRYLKTAVDARATQLINAKQNVNGDQVNQFIRLKDRLIVSQTLLNQHVVLSQFFDELEKITLANVTFTSMTLQILPNRTATLYMLGQAKTFNALAAQSKLFASEPYFKSAIFSNINPSGTDKTITFTLSATVDSRLVANSSAAAAGSAPALPVVSATTTIPRGSLPSVTSSSTPVKTASSTNSL